MDALIAAPSPKEPHTTEFVLKRSRFLTQSCHVASLNEGRAFVEEIRRQSPEANHHCWACVGGAAGDAGQAACSDDGEPHGTAGRPMLQVLLYSGIGEVCVVVTRWFGGIKLGTGGLVRAYQEAVRSNLLTLPITTQRCLATYSLVLPYRSYQSFARILSDKNGVVLDTKYGEDIVLTVSLPCEAADEIAREVGNLTNGQATLKRLES